MNCPKCTGTLEAKTYGERIVAHRCNSCAGLWCKPEVVVEVQREWMAEAELDIGDPKIGKALDALDNIQCPEGHGLMQKTADDKQTHIWFEACATCDGMFFDAGEITDLKFDTFLDRVRDFLKGRRPVQG